MGMYLGQGSGLCHTRPAEIDPGYRVPPFGSFVGGGPSVRCFSLPIVVTHSPALGDFC